MSVRWGWRAASSSSQSEMSFASVNVAMIFLLVWLSFRGFPALVKNWFPSRIDTTSLSGHGDLLSGPGLLLGYNGTTVAILDQGPIPVKGFMQSRPPNCASAPLSEDYPDDSTGFTRFQTSSCAS